MISQSLREMLGGKAKEAFPEIEIPKFDISPEKKFGDYSTNIALVIGNASKKNPLEIAKKLSDILEKDDDFKSKISRTEIAGPGFINFWLTESAIEEELSKLKKALKDGLDLLGKEKINIEFISANPTGKLHIGHGRGAFYGDTLANIFSFSGAEVSREYYINDSKESNQIKELGKTALGEGEQYKEEVAEFLDKESFSGLGEEGAGAKMAELVQSSNENFIKNGLKISFDTLYSEDKNLRLSGLNERALAEIKNKNLTYEKDEAIWLKTKEFGDDEDRVVVRSDSTYTYFLSDIAYHADKFSRGFEKVIDIWGADHHGHVKRIQAVKKMLNWTGELVIFITQLMSLKENGESAKMSKRTGNVIYLKDLVNEIGLDVTRWFFSEKALNTHMEFDINLAKEQSAKNPVFYVKYAHTRASSVVAKAHEVPADSSSLPDILKEPFARALSVKILEFPEVISLIARDCQVHRLNGYVYELATAFSQFYDNVRIVEKEFHREGALTLIKTAKDTIKKSLELLGIEAPERM